MRTRFDRINVFRGEAIDSVVGLETWVEVTICNLVLPVRRSEWLEWLALRQEYLRREVLSRMEFRSKCDALCGILAQRLPRQGKSIAELRSLLEGIRKKRNEMVHSPLVLVSDAHIMRHGTGPRPFLAGAKGDVHVSDGYMRSFRRDLERAKDLMGLLTRKLVRPGRQPKIERFD